MAKSKKAPAKKASKPLTTNQIAKKLVAYCRKGQYQECYQELYSPNVTSEEPITGMMRYVKGFKGIQKKGKAWGKQMVEMHGMSMGDPIVAGNHFACTMMYDATFKGRGREKMEEVCVYKVEDGKIISEQFFY